jgi:hypothetical protein
MSIEVTPSDIDKLGRKLVEAFARVGLEDHAFGRYWRIVGLVESFSEQAQGAFEHETAKALHNALQGRLRAVARYSVQDDAAVVAELLQSPPRTKTKAPPWPSRAARLTRLR